jgi:hypothetical protein
MVAVLCGPSRHVFCLVSGDFQAIVAARCSPWFTAVLVHGWYMRCLLLVTTESDGNAEGGSDQVARSWRIVPNAEDRQGTRTGAGEAARTCRQSRPDPSTRMASWNPGAEC